MISSYIQKEIERIDNLINSYQEDINTLIKEEDFIDEHYRKLAEEAKKNTREAIDYCQKMQQTLSENKNTLFSICGTEAVSEDKPKRTRRGAKKAEAVPVEEPTEVVDTIYPENNDEDDVFQSEEIEDPNYITQQELDNKALHDDIWNPAEDDEPSVEFEEPEEVLEESVVEETVEEEEQTDEEKSEESEDSEEGDGWPEFPEEWK